MGEGMACENKRFGRPEEIWGTTAAGEVFSLFALAQSECSQSEAALAPIFMEWVRPSSYQPIGSDLAKTASPLTRRLAGGNKVNASTRR